MSLDNDFLDIGKRKHKSPFGIASVAIAVLWTAILIMPALFGFFSSYAIIFFVIAAMQLLGVVFAIISMRNNETRRILYLIGLIINGVGFLYFILTRIS